MILKGVHHVAYVVRDMDRMVDLFMEKLHLRLDRRERFEGEGREFAFLKAGETFVELIFPLRRDDELYAFLEGAGEGALHHVAYAVEDLDAVFEEVKAQGLKTIQSRPTVAITGWRVLNLTPESDRGLRIQLAEG